jgi:methylisocitrate lyase
VSVTSAGAAFKKALVEESPLQIIGTINANHALLAQRAGFRAIYLSGGGVAAGSLGIPDLGITTLEDVLIDVRRITNVCDTPLLVDADTGFGPSAFNIGRTVKDLIKAGAAAMHIEDQVGAKRCGVDARTDDNFQIMARTDAIANEGLDAALERIHAYVQAGADLIFPEAIENLQDYSKISSTVSVPILANITEFGKTPLFTRDELAANGVRMILNPLSAFRAMNKAAENVYTAIRRDGSQANVIDTMQTRDELYQAINYYEYEKALDQTLGKDNG